MASSTPGRPLRMPHTNTPKTSERKKGLFQGELDVNTDSMTRHRRLSVLHSDSENEDCDFGMVSVLDTSSSDDTSDENEPKKPERSHWYDTRSQTLRILKESKEFNNFLKSPFTLNKFQSCYVLLEGDSIASNVSTPRTPRVEHHIQTPSSSRSCTSVYTNSSGHKKARKSLASLIADTESCSSSLKDLTFDSDSNSGSKENTPTKKSVRKSNRSHKMTPKFASFKGVLQDQKSNFTSCLSKTTISTKLDNMDVVSPTQLHKTPENVTLTEVMSLSPPKLGHNRRSCMETAESSDEASDCDRNQKRLRNDSIIEEGPKPKYPKLNIEPKARHSLFNNNRLKEILSPRSFYGKSNIELNTGITKKIENVIMTTASQSRHHSHHSNRRRNRKPGQINMGVHHRIRKPRIHNKLAHIKANQYRQHEVGMDNSSSSNNSKNNSSTLNQTELENDKFDRFDSEKQTIASLLSQWTEDELPETELALTYKTELNELRCFSKDSMAESNAIFSPVTAVPVENSNDAELMNGDMDSVIMEIGVPQSHIDEHGKAQSGFLPVSGGYIVVENKSHQTQNELLDLDKIETELKMLDEQILRMAESNNMNADAVLAYTDTPNCAEDARSNDGASSDRVKLFSIFNKPSSGLTGNAISTKGNNEKNDTKSILKNVANQYVIDAGQKKFGATQCKECGVIYEIGDPQDEHDHLVHHNATDVLKFNGWKDERVVGTWEGARCVCVRGGDAAWRRVGTLLERLIHPQLGYSQHLPRPPQEYTGYLYIDKKMIVGCLIVEHKSVAHRLIPGEPDCCSDTEYPVKCGVSRIWTHVNRRRGGIARRLLDCMRVSFLYGQPLTLDDIAFSAPTAAGKAFATTYCKTPNFYLYLD